MFPFDALPNFRGKQHVGEFHSTDFASPEEFPPIAGILACKIVRQDGVGLLPNSRFGIGFKLGAKQDN